MTLVKRNRAKPDFTPSQTSPAFGQTQSILTGSGGPSAQMRTYAFVSKLHPVPQDPAQFDVSSSSMRQILHPSASHIVLVCSKVLYTPPPRHTPSEFFLVALYSPRQQTTPAVEYRPLQARADVNIKDEVRAGSRVEETNKPDPVNHVCMYVCMYIYVYTRVHRLGLGARSHTRIYICTMLE